MSAVEAALTSLLAEPLLRNDSGDGGMTIHAFALESMQDEVGQEGEDTYVVHVTERETCMRL